MLDFREDVAVLAAEAHVGRTGALARMGRVGAGRASGAAARRARGVGAA